jgi:Tol biopolymer transport system component
VALCASPAPAQVVNGSFENAPDHLAGWTAGPGARVEALQAGNIGPGTIPVPDGSWYCMISTGPGDVPTAPGGDFDGNGVPDYDSATLSTSFTTAQPDENLCFTWLFLTDEVGPGGQGEPQYDDYFDITLDGISVARGSVYKPGGSSPYPDTEPYDGLRYTVSSSGLADNSDFGTFPTGGGRNPFRRTCIAIANPGTYTLEFLVADQADSVYDSALLIDAVEVGIAGDPTIQVTESDGAFLELKDGELLFTAALNGRVVSSRDARILAFRSTGDLTGDNPNLQEQIWVGSHGGVSYDLSRVTATVGQEHGDPGLSGNGRWLVFPSTGELAGPGNADGNLELFRYDRSGGTFTQITDTAGCTNGRASINDDGSRVAFVSDCDFGLGTTGEEIVFWDGSFRARETAGCESRDPVLSRDLAGRYVGFLTDCDGDYPGTSNPGGGFQVLQWDTGNDTYLQVTGAPTGRTNDGLASSADGRFLSLDSNADYEAGENPAGDLVAFRYDRSSGGFLQLTDPDPLALYTATAIDDTGAFIALERLDALTGGLDLVLVDAVAPRTLFPVAPGSATVANTLPAVGVWAARALVAFQSNGDFVGRNADLNTEIWSKGGAFDPPQAQLECFASDLPIPDRNSSGVSDTITLTDTGTIVDLDVTFVVEHTWVGDLWVQLEHVDTGTTVRLLDRPGRPPGPGCSGDDIDAIFDDEAGASAEGECVTPGPVAIEGPVSPWQSLSRFDGESLAGDWRIVISDRRRGNRGTVREWCLSASTQ